PSIDILNRFMRISFIALTAALCAAVASASTIQNFEIVTASDLNPIGGTFDDKATFGGTFSVDLSQLPKGGGTALPAVQITTTNGLFSGITYTSGDIIDNGSDTIFGLTLESYVLHFRTSDAGIYTLNLEFIDIPGTFTGGQIVSAIEGC